MRGKNFFFPLRLISLMLGCQEKIFFIGVEVVGKLGAFEEKSNGTLHGPAPPGVGETGRL